MKKICLYIVLSALFLSLSGCVGIPTRSERLARENVKGTAEWYSPEEEVHLPVLTEDSNLSDYLQYAILNNPKARAIYYEWLAAVEQITVSRSMPDPEFTFEVDIQRTVMALIPGLMQQIPAPGKLQIRADADARMADAVWFKFNDELISIALEVKRIYYQSVFLEEQIHLNRKILELLKDLETITRTKFETGRSTQVDVLMAQIEEAKKDVEIKNLKASRSVLIARMRATLGISADKPDPVMPKHSDIESIDFKSLDLVKDAISNNLRLKAFAADVEKAHQMVRLAYLSNIPDFTVGLEADVKPSPTILMPMFGIMLPIWRDKIYAEINKARFEEKGAKAMLSAETLNLIVNLAEQMFIVEESERNLKLYRTQVIPMAEMAIESARAGYIVGQTDFQSFLTVIDTLFRYKIDAAYALSQHQIALAEVSYSILSRPPEHGFLIGR